MNVLKNWGRASVLLAFPLAACGTIVGADFDDLEPIGGTSGSGTTGGTSPGNGGAGNGGSGGAAAGTGTAASGGTTAGSGGTPQGGAPSAGAPAGGSAGEPFGGAPQAGADQGGAGSAGEDAGGASGAGGEGGTMTVGVPPIAVVINELKGQGSGDDYIELYNTGDEVADLSDCYVVDDSNNRVTLPAGATITPKGYVVIRLQQMSSTGMVTECFGFTPCYDGVKWGISASGEVIFFHDAQGKLLDTLTYPNEMGPGNVGNGNAFGRIPDGAQTTGAIVKSAGGPNVAVMP